MGPVAVRACRAKCLEGVGCADESPRLMDCGLASIRKGIVENYKLDTQDRSRGGSAYVAAIA